MKIVEVIPIAKSFTKQSLSYFTKDSFTPGQFVRIPLRKGSTLGVVVSSSEASKSKSSLKEASFSLRKLAKVERAGELPKSFMQGAQDTASFYATSVSSVLASLLPKKFLEKPELLGSGVEEKPDMAREVKLVQLVHSERFREYRGIVRECFARGKSVLFIVPTEDEVLKSADLLSLGIEQYVFVPKRHAESLKERHPVLFISTPSHIAWSREDLDTVILERENSRAYRSLTRPFVSVKRFLEYYAKARGFSLILGDVVLSLETLWREREGEYVEFSPLSWRLKFPAELHMVDMKKNQPAQGKQSFEIFSDTLRTSVEGALAQDKKVFLFSLRKGSSPTTVCGDCGSVLLCKNCSSPLVLHSGPIYVCHHCGAKRSAETRCDACGSWKLTPLGIGIDRVALEARKLFPDAEIFIMDKDHVKTKTQARELMKQFQAAPKAILVGTELALYYVEKIPLVAAVTLDSLFSIPDFGINERAFYLVTKLREAASERMIIQTRNAGESVLAHAGAGNVLDFYREEIQEREETLFPPFSLFVKVTTEGSQEALEKKAAYLQSLFADHKPHFTLTHTSSIELAMILRVPRSSWPEPVLRDKLLLLTPDFSIKVDPESII
ncbi:hypothetical protein KW800_00425 [Candidatus Parcubacteria bacterium]|nr:hypothetical protein [Candidatus Parcubacteria bacterium]